jgi:hypothetical protein
VDIRGVKSARKYLDEIGWLQVAESQHWHRQRFGGTAVINLAWKGEPRVESSHGKSPPRKEAFPTELPPPESNKKLPQREFRNQKLTEAERSGVWREWEKKPTLANIKLQDLLEFSRTENLYRQAVARGWIKHSENQALNWVAAAVRAKSVPGDPVKIFVGIVRKQFWRFITQGQEDRARAAIVRYRETNPGYFRLSEPIPAGRSSARPETGP